MDNNFPREPENNKMKQNCWIIGFLVSVFGIIITLNFVYAQNQNYLGGLQLYNNSDYGFQVLYPQNWINRENANDEPGNFVTSIVILEPLGDQGKHYTKKFACGEVCLFIRKDNRPELNGLSIDQYTDFTYNDLKGKNSFKLLELKKPPNYKVGDKKVFEMLFQEKQGKRKYIKKLIAIPYDENSFLVFEFKSRDKYSDQIVPLMNSMVDSIKFNQTNTQ